MTALLRRALEEAEELPQEDQDAIAARLLAEIEGQRRWAASFAATTDAQWDQMIKEAKGDVVADGSILLMSRFLSKLHRFELARER